MIFAKFKDGSNISATPIDQNLICAGIVTFTMCKGMDEEFIVTKQGLPKNLKGWYLVDFLNSSEFEEFEDFEFFEAEGIDELPLIPENILALGFKVSYYRNHAEFAGQSFPYEKKEDCFEENISRAVKIIKTAFALGYTKGREETQEKMRAALGL